MYVLKTVSWLLKVASEYSFKCCNWVELQISAKDAWMLFDNAWKLDKILLDSLWINCFDSLYSNDPGSGWIRHNYKSFVLTVSYKVMYKKVK